MPQKQKILVVSRDPNLADVRKAVLESAGFVVLQAMNVKMVREACLRGKLKLVMIGYSVPPAEKRKAWQEARRHCKTPILELYRDGRPELMDDSAIFHRYSQAPDDFLEDIREIFKKESRAKKKPKA